MSTTDLPLAAELADLAARMSPLLLSAETVADAVQELTALAQDVIGGQVGVGLSLIDGGGRRTSTAATASVVLAADDAQYRLGEGPCLTAWAERRTVRVDDTGSDRRWPQWAQAAAALDVVSAVSTPLVAAGQTLGAAKVYSSRPAAFDLHIQALLAGFADTAAVLLANVVPPDDGHGLSADLRRAVRERDAVQLAKGILMQRDGLTEQQAADNLVAQVRATRQPLPQVAAAVIETAARRLT